MHRQSPHWIGRITATGFVGFVALSLIAAQTGCRSRDSSGEQGKPSTNKDEHDHSHSEPGQHGGAIIDLGQGDYHVEIVHPIHTHGSSVEESPKDVTVYLLDSELQPLDGQSVASLRINVAVDGAPLQINLQPAEDAPYTFRTADEQLCKLFQSGTEMDVIVVADIEGEAYRGTLHHGHEH